MTLYFLLDPRTIDLIHNQMCYDIALLLMCNLSVPSTVAFPKCNIDTRMMDRVQTKNTPLMLLPNFQNVLDIYLVIIHMILSASTRNERPKQEEYHQHSKELCD